MAAKTILVLAGEGRYGDAWHAFGRTARRIARELAPLGVEPLVRPTEPAAFELLNEAALLVVNGGTPGDLPPAPAGWDRAHRLLTGYLTSGRPLLALHIAANTFTDVPAWHERLGVRWAPGHSMHPPYGRAHVRIGPEAHPVTSGLGDFTVEDEKYTHLAFSGPVTPLAHHLYEGASHPLLAVREDGEQRTVYDALGHDERSYDSPARSRLLRREAAWALGLSLDPESP